MSLTVLATALALLAPQAQGCTWQLDSVGGTGQHIDLGGGRVRQYAGGGVWASCRGQSSRMYADSVAWYSEVNRVDFVGRVSFRDSAVTLDARTASYFLREERLEAAGSVRLVNRDTGSELTGPQLTYWRAVPGTRDSVELFASSRPTVRYRSGTDSADAEPYVIVAQRVRMRGESSTWAGGSVTVDRSDLHAAADSAALHLDGGLLEFLGRARVNSAGWNLHADTIHFVLVDDRIQSGIAWGDSSRPVLSSQDYDLTADSLAIDAPDQQLEEIRGFGGARAVARLDSARAVARSDSVPTVSRPDSARADTLAESDSVRADPSFAEPDWVAGDTLTARFDTTGAVNGERTLESLEARGNALAFYRVYEEDGRTLAGINYSRGTRILALFRADGIERVHVVGGSDGVYLEPVRRPPP